MKQRGQHKFIQFVMEGLRDGQKLTRLKLEKKGRELVITDKRLVKELTEFSVLLLAREQIQDLPLKEAYEELVGIYNIQPNSSYRSSDVAIMRQYSTPLPISFLLGRFVSHGKMNGHFLEPSAGNGLLTIGLPVKQTDVNELDELRADVLERGGFNSVSSIDASKRMPQFNTKYDGVISNPPFGKLRESVNYEGVEIQFMDHLMILRALDKMKDNGRAAFVTGTHLKFDQRGRISKQQGRFFFSYLYANYKVIDNIPIDGNSLYTRQGTGMDTSLILIDGRKKEASGLAPSKSNYASDPVVSHQDLFNRISKQITMKFSKSLSEKAKAITAKLRGAELGAPYVPTSESCNVLDTEVPDTMAFEMHDAMKKVKDKVGGDIDNFVRDRLGYISNTQLCKVLAAEQIDAVAMAIYNIEAKDQGCIIGDQTGIGKGRVAAALMRYGARHGLKPIFLTEKANLFSDIYRDLIAIGSSNLKPFIVNSKESKTNIKDSTGKIIYSAPSKFEQTKIFQTAELEEYDLILATYSQFNSSAKENLKKDFLSLISMGRLLIMDESHNASGSSNTGSYLRRIVGQTKSTIFLSATFAKRPDNMPIYALKTSISDANLSTDSFISAVNRGGVALQEILASQLVAEGQMIRRERSYENVIVEYRTLDHRKDEHFAIADRITQIMRDIIAFQEQFISPLINDIDDEYAKQNKEIRARGGTSEMGINNTTYFSKIFNVINQMLFAIKAEDVAEAAIAKLREGKKPLIAFSSTMGSFLTQLIEEAGIRPGDGNKIQTDFALILKNGLDGVMRYTEMDAVGEKTYSSFDLNDLGMEGRMEYLRIESQIEDSLSGIFISPIDVILDKIRKAGYSAQEVTGRSVKIDFDKGYLSGKVSRVKKVNVNDAFAMFNDNEIDVLLINQSGSTGASAHAIPTPKVPASQVKPRVMIVLQMELNVDTEIQKRGRIFRTGQIHQPEYVYLNSAIPAEQRLMMMLSQKLKSLDANTSSNQNQNKKMMNIPDFLNKYGDRIVSDFLDDESDLHRMLGSPDLGNEGGAVSQRVSGRVAVMPTEQQTYFYEKVTANYLEYIDYLKQTGDYDLEVEDLNLQAKTLSKQIVVLGNGGNSKFGTDTYLEKLEVNALKKPFKSAELKQMLLQKLNGRSPEEYRDQLIRDFDNFTEPQLKEGVEEIETKFTQLLTELPKKKSLLKLWEKEGEHTYEEEYQRQKTALENERESKLSAKNAQFRNRQQLFHGLAKFFTVGRPLSFQQHSFTEKVFATFLGFDISESATNPYAPSAIKLKFAIASHLKMLVLPASFATEINAIRGASYELSSNGIDSMLSEWDDAIRSKNQDRIVRYMRTGNLVQGYSDGRLVSYTTIDGKTEKGILLSENFQNDKMKKKVTVPLLRASGLIRSMVHGKQLELSDRISITRSSDYFEVRVPASASAGGQFFMEELLIDLTVGRKFEKVSNTMRAKVEDSNLIPFLNVLQNEFGVNIEITWEEYERVKDSFQNKLKVERKIVPPVEGNTQNLLQLRAKAISMKLKLLNHLKKSA